MTHPTQGMAPNKDEIMERVNVPTPALTAGAHSLLNIPAIGYPVPNQSQSTRESNPARKSNRGQTQGDQYDGNGEDHNHEGEKDQGEKSYCTGRHRAFFNSFTDIDCLAG